MTISVTWRIVADGDDRVVSEDEHYYFGPWRDDPKGEHALKDPELGWLARKDAIRAGVDNIRVSVGANPNDLTLGELMGRFLIHKRNQVSAGDLSIRTRGDYIEAVGRFVSFHRPGMPVSALKPELQRLCPGTDTLASGFARTLIAICISA